MKWYVQTRTKRPNLRIGPFADAAEAERYIYTWAVEKPTYGEYFVVGTYDEHDGPMPIDHTGEVLQKTTPWQYVGVSEHKYREQNAKGTPNTTQTSVVDTEDRPKFRMYAFLSGLHGRTFHGWVKEDGQIAMLENDAGTFRYGEISGYLQHLATQELIGEKVLEICVRRIIK